MKLKVLFFHPFYFAMLSIINLFSSHLQVVLAANDLPSINDVTYHELIEILSQVAERNVAWYL